MATEPEDKEQPIVTFSDPQKEYSVDQVTQRSENEVQGAVESFDIYSTHATNEPEEHNQTSSPQDNFTISTNGDLTSPPSADKNLEFSEVIWQKVGANPVNAVPKTPNQNHSMHEREPDVLQASNIDVVRSSNHRHYQPMPDANLEPVDYMPPTQVQPEGTEEPSADPEEIDRSKHLLDTNPDDEDLINMDMTMTTEGTTLEYDSRNHTTAQEVLSGPSTFLPGVEHNGTLEDNVGNVTEAPETDEDLGFSYTTQFTSVSTTSNADRLEGSGEDFIIEKTDHLVTEHESETHEASTSETVTESFSTTYLTNTSLGKCNKIC